MYDKKVDLDFMREIPEKYETMYRNNRNVILNKKLVFNLLNVFPTQKLRSSIYNMVTFNELNLSDWLLSRIVSLANYDFDILEDECSSRKNGINRDSETILKVADIEVNKKLHVLGYVLKVVSVIFVNLHISVADKEEQDKMFIKFFYNLVMRLNCNEILDDIIMNTLNTDSKLMNEERVYDEYTEYQLINYFVSRTSYNPFVVDTRIFIGNSIQFNLYSYRDFRYRIFKTYNRKYSEYIILKNYKNSVDLTLSGSNSREKFDYMIDKILHEDYSDFIMNELLYDIVRGYDHRRPEYCSNQLFEYFIDKYKYVGTVYHGSRDITGRNKNIAYLVSQYRTGTISASKSIKEALKFAKFEDFDGYSHSSINQYGFVAELNITEDMIAIDIEKMLLDLKEKLPGLTTWITDKFIEEKEVLILAEYIHDAKIMTYEEAEKIDE